MSAQPARGAANAGSGQAAATSAVTQPAGRVLIVDDSAVVRQVLTKTLEREPGLSVMGAVSDPLFAMQRMQKDWPDALVLDVEMPRMDGITFLRKLMAERPLPVVVCSTLTGKGTETCMQALSAGAFAVVEKPTQGLREFLTAGARQLISAVQAAVASRNRAGLLVPAARVTAPTLLPRATVSAAPPAALARTTERVVAIGTSTGGTQALERVLLALPRVSPGIVVVQHMPEKFTASFAARLDSLAELEVREAVTGDRVAPGRVLIAPGGRHLRLTRSGALYQVEVVDGPPVNRHRPSVDVLFRSVAKVAGSNALGILMTGMGDDGARGLLEMRQCGAETIAQDEASCVVFGMPKEAIRLGAAGRVMSLDAIPAAIRAE